MGIRDIERCGPSSWLWDVRDQLKQHIYRRSVEAFTAGDAARDAITLPEELAKRCDYLRDRFIESLGGLPPNDTPLNAQITGTIQCDGFRIEKVIFESRPKSYITANLYVPDGVESPRGAVLFVCGHHAFAKHVPEYQAVCRRLVNAGLVVLAQDPIGQGERFSYLDPSDSGALTIGSCCPEHDYAGTQCLLVGDNLARYFVHDAMRGIDYLMTRPEVDPKKIGVTGNSGGGTQTSLMMVCDPRIAAAAPGTFIMNRQTYLYTGEAQDAEQVWPGMSALGFDHEDILLMMCPKPVMVLAVTWDFFPIEGTRRTVERCARLWEMFGRGESLRIVEDESTHKYTDKLADSAAAFFSKHLLGKELGDSSGTTVTTLEPERLWCTKSGQVRTDMPDARAAWEENLDRMALVEKARQSLSSQERETKAMEWLRERVFADRTPVAPNLRLCGALNYDDLSVQYGMWWSQEDLIGSAALFRRLDFAGKELPVTLAVWDGGTSCMHSHLDWIRGICESGRAVMVLNVTGVGDLVPNPVNLMDMFNFYGTMHKLACDMIWLNDSLAALRIYDVIRALDVIPEWPGITAEQLECYAHGRYGTYCRLAAMVDPRLADVNVVDGLSGYGALVKSRYYNSEDIYSILLPDVLKFLDL